MFSCCGGGPKTPPSFTVSPTSDVSTYGTLDSPPTSVIDLSSTLSTSSTSSTSSASTPTLVTKRSYTMKLPNASTVFTLKLNHMISYIHEPTTIMEQLYSAKQQNVFSDLTKDV